MFGIGPGELIIILVLAFIIVGPERLPELGRNVGRIMAEFKSQSDVLRSTLTMESTPPVPPTGFPVPAGTHLFGGFAGNLAAMQVEMPAGPEVVSPAQPEEVAQQIAPSGAKAAANIN